MKTYKLKDVTVTEEEIKRLAIEAGIVEPEKVEKPFGELYVGLNGTLAFFLKEREAFGFSFSGKYVERSRGWERLQSKSWQPTTEDDRQRWEKLLLEKAESMGYENGNHKCLCLDTAEVKGGELYFDRQGNIWFGIKSYLANMVFNGETGEWAKIIEKTSVQDEWDSRSYLNKSEILISILKDSKSSKQLLRCIAEAMCIDNYDKDEEFTAY